MGNDLLAPFGQHGGALHVDDEVTISVLGIDSLAHTVDGLGPDLVAAQGVEVWPGSELLVRSLEENVVLDVVST